MLIAYNVPGIIGRGMKPKTLGQEADGTCVGPFPDVFNNYFLLHNFLF